MGQMDVYDKYRSESTNFVYHDKYRKVIIIIIFNILDNQYNKHRTLNKDYYHISMYSYYTRARFLSYFLTP